MRITVASGTSATITSTPFPEALQSNILRKENPKTKHNKQNG